MSAQRRKLKILVVYAHPGDIACEASGTLMLHAVRGDEIHCVLLSDGERHHNDLIHRERSKPKFRQKKSVIESTVEDIKAFKRVEAQRICDYIGIKKMYAFGWPDVLWQCAHERIEEIASVIREVRPAVILGHVPWGEFQSQLSDVHAIAGHMTRMAAWYCSDSLPQIDGREPHHTKAIFWFPMMGMADTAFRGGTGVVCDFWVDISSVIKRKCHAIDLLVSQGYQGSCARKILEAREGRWGMLCGCSYAEPWFYDRAPCYEGLPVTSETLKKKYVPNDVPGDAILTAELPSRIPPESFAFPIARRPRP